MPGFAEQVISPGSINSLEAASSWRQAEAELMRSSNRFAAELYLAGYVVELKLTAGCARILGFGLRDPLDRAFVDGLRKDARARRLMTADPHHLSGLTRYLLFLRGIHRTGTRKAILFGAQQQSDTLYEQWRPSIRYKAMTPTGAQMSAARTAVYWFVENYAELWS